MVKDGNPTSIEIPLQKDIQLYRLLVRLSSSNKILERTILIRKSIHKVNQQHAGRSRLSHQVDFNARYIFSVSVLVNSCQGESITYSIHEESVKLILEIRIVHWVEVLSEGTAIAH